jgi:signal transduction histidine kinase
MNIRGFFKEMPKWLAYVLVTVGLVSVFILDYFTGNEISFSILYLIPISLCLWYIGKWEAIISSVISAILWYFGENRMTYISDTIAYWNAFVRLGFFFIVVILLDYVKKYNHSLGDIIKARTIELEKEITVRKKVEEEVKEKNEQLSNLAMSIEKVKEEENLKIAREIHDELGQVLTALKMEVNLLGQKLVDDNKSAKKLDSVNDLIDETINLVRKISTRLRPRLLDELGLFPAMEMQVRELQTRTGIRCITQLPEVEIINDKEMSLAIFRIFQEALTNIIRHAKATNVLIKSYLSSDHFVMEIKDNGIGIGIIEQTSNGSLGILGMRERVSLLNGNLNIENISSGGTLLRVDIPINNNNH